MCVYLLSQFSCSSVFSLDEVNGPGVKMALGLFQNPITACRNLVRSVTFLLIQYLLKFLIEENRSDLGSILKAFSAIPIPNSDPKLFNRSKKKAAPPPPLKKQSQKAATTRRWLLSVVLNPISSCTNLISLLKHVVLNPVSTCKYLIISLVKHVAQKFVPGQVELNLRSPPWSSSSSPDSIHPSLANVINNLKSFELDDKALHGDEFDEYLDSMSKTVNNALDGLVTMKHPEKVHEAMRYSLLAGGKRVRPILCIASCRLVGGDEASALPMACAVEIMHTASLIVDDLPCMDNDDLRRGKPANHKMFGEQVSILSSAGLFALAFQHVAAAEYPDMVSVDRVVRGIVELASALGAEGLVGGQFMDLDSEGKDISEEELEFLHVNKTSKLLEASVVCGAIVGGANEKDIEKLRKYARLIGLSFQVVDDILDVTQPTEKLGKTAAKDLLSKKATFPKLMGLDNAKKFANKLVDEAIQEISHFDAAKAAPLYHIAHYINNRQN